MRPQSSTISSNLKADLTVGALFLFQLSVNLVYTLKQSIPIEGLHSPHPL